MKKLLFLSFIFFQNLIFSQNPAAADLVFPNGLNQFAHVTAIQLDGKILVGGFFNSLNGNAQNYLVRLNADGTKDTSFNVEPGLNYIVYSIAIQSDGKILVGGEFNSFNGNTQNYLIRLNADGTKDTSFNIGVGFNSYIEDIAIQSDGKILVGGQFTTFNGSTQKYLVRLNANGTRDNSFNVGTKFNNTVLTIVVQSDDKILIGGNFTTFNGSAQNRLIRLNTDGTKDSNFDIGTGFTVANANYFSLYSIVLQPDGKILVGGAFNTFNGNIENRLIRLHTDGTKDSSFNIASGFNDNVFSIALQSDNKILVGGSFTIFNGNTQNRLIRLNADGTQDNGFNIGTGFNESVYSLLVQSDGKVWLAGGFTSYNGTVSNRIIRLNGGLSLSVDNFSKDKIKVYPNPTKNSINFVSVDDNGISEYVINDVLGKKISKGNLNTNSINVENLEAGVYILKITTNRGILTSKFIKE